MLRIATVVTGSILSGICIWLGATVYALSIEVGRMNVTSEQQGKALERVTLLLDKVVVEQARRESQAEAIRQIQAVQARQWEALSDLREELHESKDR